MSYRDQAIRIRIVMLSTVFASSIAASSAYAQQTEAARGDGIEEIVVTAQKRAENLQDVPISIQAFSNTTLTQSGVTELEDLPALVPGLTFGRSAGGSVTFIRGVGATDTAAGQEAPISTYVDGVYMQSLWSNNAALKNVERVEVLKGPQGTLFGRNATGGLMHIITRDPSSDPSGEISFSAGNYKTFEVSAYATTGIAGNLAADFTGYVRRQEKGYSPNILTGNAINFNNEATVRSKWQYTGERTTVTLAGDYADIEDTRGLNRNLLPGAIGSGGTRGTGDFYAINANVDYRRNTRAYGGSLQIDHDFDWANLVSLSAIRRDRSHFIFDNDIGPLPLNKADITYRTKTFSQELRLSSAPGARNSWIVGAFYFHSNASALLRVLVGANEIQAVRFDSRLLTDSYSVFGEYGLAIGENGRLTVGGRYTADRRRVSGAINLNRLPGLKDHWESPTWRLVYDHHVSDDVMLYASYNRGFKSGNFNILPANQPSYDPEKIDAYEIGAKTSFLDNRIRLNLAGFYYDYRDLQVRITSGLTTQTFNAASAEIKGLEGDLTAKIGSAFTLTASAAYVDAKYKDFPNAPDYVPFTPGQRCPGVTTGAIPTGGNCLVSFDASGKQLIRSPKFSANIGGVLVVPTGLGELTANARMSYRDGFPWDPSGRIRENSNINVTAGLVLESVDKSWNIGVRGENIFGSHYQTYGGSVDTGDYFSSGAPAVYSVALGFKF